MRRLAIVIAAHRGARRACRQRGWVGDRHARAAARGPGGGRDVDGAPHGAAARTSRRPTAPRRRSRFAARTARRPFTAKPAGTTGKYVAHVVFPTAGSWDYEVSDGLAATGYGYSQTHTYSPVDDRSGNGRRGEWRTRVAVRPRRDRPRRCRRHRARPTAGPPSSDSELIVMNRLLTALALAFCRTIASRRVRVGCARQGQQRPDLVLERSRGRSRAGLRHERGRQAPARDHPAVLCQAGRVLAGRTANRVRRPCVQHALRLRHLRRRRKRTRSEEDHAWARP